MNQARSRSSLPTRGTRIYSDLLLEHVPRSRGGHQKTSGLSTVNPTMINIVGTISQDSNERFLSSAQL